MIPLGNGGPGTGETTATDGLFCLFFFACSSSAFFRGDGTWDAFFIYTPFNLFLPWVSLRADMLRRAVQTDTGWGVCS